MLLCVFGARFPPLSGVFFVLLVLAGCAAPQTRALRESAPPSLPKAVEITRTPFFPQEEFQCGPAALATTLNFAGLAASPRELAQQVFLPARRGSLQVEMLAAARRRGTFAITLPPQLDALLTEVANGTPVIVLQNLALDWVPMWHYAVVIGYDLGTNEIILRSGRTERLTIPMSVFERTWKRSGYWSMVTVSPGTVPATVTPEEYLQAAIAFERIADPRAAMDVYLAATLKWPDHQLAMLGLGNTAYALQDWQTAELAFRSLAAAASDPVPALNNLALVLDAQGRLPEALDVAHSAVALGGQFAEQSRKTLAALSKKTGTNDNND